jgi:hypothetical protein
MQPTNYPQGLTVKELKEIIKNWPETDKYGEPTTVWVETGWCLSSIVTEISPLHKYGNIADIILSSNSTRTG